MLSALSFVRRGVVLVVSGLFLVYPVDAATIRVPADYGTIWAGVEAAAEGDTVLVAPGTYTGEDNRNVVLAGRVLLSEAGAASTIIDCEGVDRGLRVEPSSSATPTVVDGFTVRYADWAWGAALSVDFVDECATIIRGCVFDSNGLDGWYSAVQSYYSTVEIIDCTFTNNASDEGGGLYCEGSDVTLVGCTFTGNAGYYYGGAMRSYDSSLTVTDCTFAGNSCEEYGGAIYLEDGSVTLSDCVVSGNTSYYEGGGVYSYDVALTLSDCVVSGNTSDSDGGGVYSHRDDFLILSDCVISDNYSARDGGGICGYYSRVSPDSPVTVRDCQFTGNVVDGYGAAMSFRRGDVEMLRCTLTGNSAPWGCGTVDFNSGATFAMNDCIVTGNRAGWWGGAGVSYWRQTVGSLTNCTIADNVVELSDAPEDPYDHGAAGIMGWESRVTFENCTITGNRTDSAVGGYYGYVDTTTFVNCVIADNAADSTVAAVYLDAGSVATFVNTTVANNRAAAGAAVYAQLGSRAHFSNCVVWGNSGEAASADSSSAVTFGHSDVEGGAVGIGNVDADPLFADAAGGDYHLTGGSPCIDTGTADGAPDTDFEGDVRPTGDGVDMGADEHVPGVGDCDLDVQLAGAPDSVRRGGVLLFRGAAINECEEPRTVDRAVMDFTGPVTVQKVLYSGAPVPIATRVEKSFGLGVPSGAPLGTYTVTVSIYRDGEVIDFDAFDVDVVD